MGDRVGGKHHSSVFPQGSSNQCNAVGAQGGSCLECDACKAGDENYCVKPTNTYGGYWPNGGKSMGGYATHNRTHGHFVIPIPDKIDSAEAAPFLCGGVTVRLAYKTTSLHFKLNFLGILATCAQRLRSWQEGRCCRCWRVRCHLSPSTLQIKLTTSPVSATLPSSSPRHSRPTKLSVSPVKPPRKTKSSSSVPTATLPPTTTKTGPRPTPAAST